MLNTKKNFFIALLMVFTFCFTAFSNVSYAAETDSFQLPSDAVILYQDDNIIVYQTHKETINSPSNSTISPMSEDNYGYAWVDKGGLPGSFKVHNTYSGRVGVTWKVEASSRSDYARIYMTNPFGLIVLSSRDVHPSDGDVRFVLVNGMVGNYTVYYIPAQNTNGMRIMCWTYGV